jgi:hypothetical protein
MTLQLNLRLRFEVDDTGRLSGPGDRCYLGTEAKPQSITLIADRREALLGIHPGRARGYYPKDGLVVLAGTNPEPLPGASCCGLFCFGDGAVDHAFGTPAEPGAATVTVIGRISPRLLPGRAAPRERAADHAASWSPDPAFGVRLGLR